MYLFGLKRVKPLAAVRLGGMRLLRIRRSETASVNSDFHYLRHASAMSAAIAKNMSTIMSQTSELVHSSSTSNTESFLVTHNHYSFIVVVALMSLFLVITISATGLLLAFCRKKNTVFIAAPQSDADSQFELDDIESSDIEMYLGDKGECYMHLSDEYDDGDYDYDEEDNCYEDGKSDGLKHDKDGEAQCAKRSNTFPQFCDVLNGCNTSVLTSKGTNSVVRDCNLQPALMPLISSSKNKLVDHHCSDELAGNQQQNLRKTLHLQHEHNKVTDGYSGLSRVLCQNPDHMQHHYYYINLPHHRQRQPKIYHSGRTQNVRWSRSRNGAGRLHRSHTIHAIPISEKRAQLPSTPTNQIYSIKVQNVNNLHSNDVCDNLKNFSLTTHEAQGISEVDIFNDEDCQIKSPFDNLKLLMAYSQDKEDEDSRYETQVPETSNDRCSLNVDTITDYPHDSNCDIHTDVWMASKEEAEAMLLNSVIDVSCSRTSASCAFVEQRTTFSAAQMCYNPNVLIDPIEACEISMSASLTDPTVISETNSLHISSQNGIVHYHMSSTCTSSEELCSTNQPHSEPFKSKQETVHTSENTIIPHAHRSRINSNNHLMQTISSQSLEDQLKRQGYNIHQNCNYNKNLLNDVQINNEHSTFNISPDSAQNSVTPINSEIKYMLNTITGKCNVSPTKYNDAIPEAYPDEFPGKCNVFPTQFNDMVPGTFNEETDCDNLSHLDVDFHGKLSIHTLEQAQLDENDVTHSNNTNTVVDCCVFKTQEYDDEEDNDDQTTALLK